MWSCSVLVHSSGERRSSRVRATTIKGRRARGSSREATAGGHLVAADLVSCVIHGLRVVLRSDWRISPKHARCHTPNGCGP